MKHNEGLLRHKKNKRTYYSQILTEETTEDYTSAGRMEPGSDRWALGQCAQHTQPYPLSLVRPLS